jgi:hypothetical protein
VRLFDIGTNRGPGAEVAIVYDAKNVGSEVLANDEGSAFWTLPINHPEIDQFIPLKRHYKIERLNHDTGSYDLVGAGLLMSADITRDEIVFTGSDYMGIMNTHYTKVLGAAIDATSPLVYGSGGSTTTTEVGNFTLDMATAGVGRSFTTIANTADLSTVTSDWNSHDEEEHLALGAISSTTTYTIRGGLRFDLTTNANWAASTRITKAVLRLYGSTYGHVSKTSSTSRNLQIQRMTTEDWTADSTTGTEGFYSNSSTAACDWTSVNANVTGTVITKAFTGISNNALYEVDITEIVQSWKSGSTNYGIRLKNSAEQTVGRGLEFFGSKYATTSKRPKLYIEYETDTTSSTDTDPDGLFKYKEETKKWLEVTRITGREASLASNSSTTALASRTPINVYFLDKTSSAMASGNYWPGQDFYPNGTTFDNTTAPTIINRFMCRYDEANEKYILSGVVRVERAKQLGTSGADNDWFDYVNNNNLLADFKLRDLSVSISASPGGEVCSFYLWKASNTADGYSMVTSNTWRSLEFPFWVEIYKTGTANVKLDPPAAPSTDSSVDYTVSAAVVGGLTRYAVPTTAQYKLPILSDGQSYEFTAVATAVVNDSSDHGLKSGVAAPYNQDKSPLSLRTETLEDIFDRYLLTADEGAFDQKALSDGTEVGRLNWASIENVAGSWPTNTLRYFTTGENVTDFLRNMADKQMATNDTINIDGTDLPARCVFNFVGIRKANGNPADASKLFVNPTMSNTAVLTLEYPGVIGEFRYNSDGRRVKNNVRIISSTPFLSGAYTAMSGVRLQGSTAKDEASQREYGLAPILTGQAGFLDSDEASKGAQRLLEQRVDFTVAAELSIQIERDRLNPFKDFFLGDAVRVYIRRDNININNSLSGNILAGIYIISGVTYKSPVDGAEDVTLQLMNGKYFAAMKQ